MMTDSPETVDSETDRKLQDDEETEDSSTSLDLLRSLNIGENARKLLRTWKPENKPKKRRGPGRPPSTGEYVGYAKAKREVVESRLLEIDARFSSEVTNKLCSAAAIYDKEGTIEGVPMGEIGASIGEALEAIYMVS